jgi:hypothetical protein
VSQDLLWSGDCSGTQARERPPLEAGTRGLVKGQQTEETKCVYSEVWSVRNRVRLRIVIKNLFQINAATNPNPTSIQSHYPYVVTIACV